MTCTDTRGESVKTFTAVVVGLTLVLCGTAYAQSPVVDAYAGPAGVAGEVTKPPSGVKNSVAENVAPTADRAAPASRVAALPFTGADVVLMLAAGAALLAVGIGVRRLARPRL
jgi:hypothetical protein